MITHQARLACILAVAIGSVCLTFQLTPSPVAPFAPECDVLPDVPPESTPVAELVELFPAAEERLPVGIPIRVVASERQLTASNNGLVATCPRRYADGISIARGDLVLRQRLVGSTPSERQDINDGARYDDVLPGVDALVHLEGITAEELLVVGAGGQQSFSYEFSLEGAATFEIHGDHLFASDAAGTRKLVLDDAVYWTTGDEQTYPAKSCVVPLGPKLARLEIRIPAEHRARELLLDPSWRMVGTMIEYRRQFATATLQNGLILVCGGYDSNLDPLSSVEAYSPATESWYAAPSMKRNRFRMPAVTLADGRVLVMGGTANNGARATCELFTAGPIAGGQLGGSWAYSAPMNTARYDQSATLRPETGAGRVVVIGGINGNWDTVTTAEVYTVASDSWYSLTSTMTSEHSEHSAVMLPTMEILVAGGVDDSSAPTRDCSLLDISASSPSSWTFRDASPMPANEQRFDHTADIVSNSVDDFVFLFGGVGTWVHDPSPLLYRFSTDEWFGTGGNPPNQYRSGHTSTRLLDGSIVIAGGSNPSGTLTSVVRFRLGEPGPFGGMWTPVWTSLPDMIHARQLHGAAFLPTESSTPTVGVFVFAGDGAGTAEYLDD